MTRTPRRFAVPALALIAILLASTTGHSDPPGRRETAPWPRKGEYVGAEKCMQCHDDEAQAILKGDHHDVVHSDAAMGCETCHGPGLAHVLDPDHPPEKITYPGELTPEVQTRMCKRCHEPQATHHGGGGAEAFVIAKRGCTECHGIHEAREERPLAALRLRTKAATDAMAEPVGAERCTRCHEAQNRALLDSPHHSLAQTADSTGCETCHGDGSVHVENGGISRAITRPDVARDGVQTCRACHEEVDARAFHWKDKKSPLLSPDMTCTTCHSVHGTTGHGGPRRVDPETGESERNAPTNQLCATCHAPAFEVLGGTIHETLGAPNAPLSQGCASCHAGAEEHALAGGVADLVESMHGSDAKLQHATCMQCHEDDAAVHAVEVGAHHKRNVSCLSCHSPAAPRERVREDAEAKCASCHQDVAAQFRLPNRHPLGQGMGCSDCHAPHTARHRIRDHQLREGSCVDCHRQYRGPFVFAHQASRRDGCVACHVPHGSPNRRMLMQVNTQQNCLQCHADFPAFHDQTEGAIYTNCLNCHTRVHGSNHSRFLFR